MPRGRLQQKQTQIEKYRKECDQYGISFEGPIPYSRYPAQYATAFEAIRNIKKIEFDNYDHISNGNETRITEIKRWVCELNNHAYSCRNNVLDELGWRFRTENNISSRFMAEVICKKCGDQIWKPDFEASPSDLEELERVQKMRLETSLCECGPESKAEVDAYDNGRVSMYTQRWSQRIIHEDIEGPNSSGSRSQAPDYVLGLGVTKSLEYYTSKHPSLRHCPYRDGQILYPFLVIEAKSEKRSPGWEYIECQTALTLRTCLRLQENLERETKIDIQPLVWFFGYQGENWRLYAAWPESGKVRVIVLWHGDICSQDDGLQLYLIMDYICDWARVVYREKILCCLAGGRANLRAFTPAPSQMPSQRTEGGFESLNRFDSFPFRPAAPAATDPTSLTGRAEDQDDSMNYEDSSNATHSELDVTSLVDDTHPFLQWSNKHYNPEHWTAKATIRHPDLALIEVKHLNVPDNERNVRSFLHIVHPGLNINQSAGRLLDIFGDSESTITIRADAVYSNKDLMLGAGRLVTAGDTSRFRAAVVFRTFFRTSDWQTIRQLSLITCTPTAVSQLAKLSGRSHDPLHLFDDRVCHECECFSSALASLRGINGRLSTLAASSQLSMNLLLGAKGEDTEHLGWVIRPCEGPFDNLLNELDTYVLKIQSSTDLSPKFLQQSSRLWENRSNDVELQMMDEQPKFADLTTKKGIILKKPLSWPLSCPLFCFVAFETAGFGDQVQLGNMISEAKKEGDFWAETAENGKIEQCDQAFLRTWIQILRGNLPDYLLQGQNLAF